MAKKDRFITSYKIGQDNIQKWGMDVHNAVFFISAALVILFVVSTLANPGGAKKIFDAAKRWTIQNFDWFFMISGNIFVLFCLFLICLPVGKIRLGGPDAKPEFKRGSWFAMLFAAGMGIGLMFWSVAGSFSHFFLGCFKTLLAYMQDIVPLSNWIGRTDEKFYKGWTIFYWAWWISWAPFVGMFIARISKGRTIREFLIAVLMVPTVLTVIWMQAFGGNALLQIQTNVGALSKGLGEVSLATFQMLANLPLTQITSFLGIVLALVFFVTSSDSGSLVVDSITAGGKLDAPMPQRVFWAVMEGAIAAALLVGGGADALGAIQAVAVTVGLPFTAVMLVMVVSTYLGVRSENLAAYRSPPVELAKKA